MNKKVFIITGTNKGLGKGFVDILINKKDCSIISISRSIIESQKKIPKKNFYFLKTDLSYDWSIEKLNSIKKIIDSKEIYFINNASIINPILKIENLDMSEVNSLISVNILSTIKILKFLLKNFKKNKKTFVNISTGAAKKVVKNWSLYCSSKAFTEMFFKVAESEYENYNFYNIDPGVMDTNMQRKIRNSDFPDVNSFKKLKENNDMKSPKYSALEILKKINIQI